MNKLAIITTHPIQYNAPIFKLLAERKKISIKVFYTWGEDVSKKKYDPGFGKIVEWDIPLLDGYEYTFVKNVAEIQGSGHFMGIDNPELINEIKAYNPNALLLFGWCFKSHLQCLRYFYKKIPILFRGDSTLLNKSGWLKNNVRTFFLKWVYRHLDYALYVGTHNKNYFKQYGLKDEQLIKAPHAVDNERFILLNKEYTDKAIVWKASLGIKSYELTVLYAGKLEAVKNLYFLFEIADMLKNLPIKFIIVGNGSLEVEMKKRSKNNKQIIFIDFQNQSMMPIVYRLGDIFMLSSKNETWGLGANEAMASGCAIFLSEMVGSAIDLIPENKNGFKFSLKEPKKCADLIIELSKNDINLAKMKKINLGLIQNFSLKNIVIPIENIVDKIIS